MGVDTAPVTWTDGVFATEHAVGLAVCVAHRGRHIWYLERCYRPQPLIHVRGFRYIPGQRYSYRFGRCPEHGCPVEIANRLDLQTGKLDRLDAETDRPHWHPQAPKVEIDEQRLAAAIVAASRATRDERRADVRRTSADRPVAPSPPDEPPPERPSRDTREEIPTVTVWSPGPDDGVRG